MRTRSTKDLIKGGPSNASTRQVDFVWAFVTQKDQAAKQYGFKKDFRENPFHEALNFVTHAIPTASRS